jgi:hypothetical protein
MILCPFSFGIFSPSIYNFWYLETFLDVNNSIKRLHLFEYDTMKESRPGIAPAPELLMNIIVQQKLSLEKCR